MPLPQTLNRYLARRRFFETAFWILFFVVEAAANSTTALIDMRRGDPDFPAWKPLLWESSGTLIWLPLLLMLIAGDRRYPLRWDNWRMNLPRHLFITVVLSLLHVSGMVLVRKLVYAALGQHYDFGSWRVYWFYEYLKDVRTYFYLLAFVYFYRLLLLRLQGEASLLAAPDEGPPLEPVERPERFLVRKLGKEFLIAANDIEWLEAAGNYVNLHLRGHLYPLRSTMAAIESRLDPARFRRVHRSYIINLDQLAQIEPLDTGDAQLLLRNGQRLPCSRKYRGALRA